MAVAATVEKNPENLTPLAKALLVPSLSEEEVKVAVEEDKVPNFYIGIEVISHAEMHQLQFHSIPSNSNKL